MKKIKITCCHHLPLSHRKEKIKTFFKNDKFEVEFEESFQFGVDLHDNPHKITNGELSLMMKHYKIYENLVSSNDEYSIIIEDDLIVPENFDLYEFFTKIISEIKNSDLIFFGGTHNMIVNEKCDNKYVYEGYSSSRCTHGYLITKNCANKILSNKFYEKPIDHALNYYIKRLNLNCSWTYPHLSQSTVEGSEKSSLR